MITDEEVALIARNLNRINDVLIDLQNDGAESLQSIELDLVIEKLHESKKWLRKIYFNNLDTSTFGLESMSSATLRIRKREVVDYE